MDANAIPEIVTTLLNHPEAFIVLANLVNSAALGWLHYHRSAIHSFLPEPELPSNPSSDSYGPKAWKISALPAWQPKTELGVSEIAETLEGSEIDQAAGHASKVSKAGAPYPNHRWLPLRDNDTSIYITPIADTAYHPFSADWKEWAIAAQQHYSLLQNLEENQLEKYTVGGDGTWNLRYMRGNINLAAFWADDVLDNLPFEGSGDDEHQLTIALPEKMHKGTIISFQLSAIQSTLTHPFRMFGSNQSACIPFQFF